MTKGNICIISGEIKGDYNDGYVIGVEKCANALEYQTTIFSMLCEGTVDTNKEEIIYSYIDFDQYDGIIFNEHSFSAHKHLARSVEKLLKKHCRVPIVTIGKSDVSEDSFLVDGRADFEAITEHMIVVHGCTRIYCLGGSKQDLRSRVEGFQQAVKKHGLCEEDCAALYGGYWVDCAEKLARDIVSGDIEMPEAVVCVTDIVAFALIKALFRHGIRVPEDIRVCGYNAHPCAFNSLISITTYPVDTKECGARAMNRLHELITGRAEPMKQRIAHSIITGRSCGCGPQSPSNLRFRLAEAEREDLQETYFRNAKLEEAMMEAASQDEMEEVVRNREYLVPHIRVLAVNLLEQDGTMVCRYLSNNRSGGLKMVEPGKLFPSNGILPDNVRNCHVVPLVYNGVNYGYVVAGYGDPLVYDKCLKRFCHCLALWCRIGKKHRGRELQKEVEKGPIHEGISDGETTARSAETVFGKKNNLIHKINIGQIFYFEALEKKVYAITKNGAFQVKLRLFEIEKAYAYKRFMRVSKSVVINLDKIESVKLEEDRSGRVFFAPQISARVSRAYLKEFKSQIGM
ncbi:MAG: substrate-binding domain-containing protein [Lachnospiraceae bacterium]|nr:substrate-binding domain-containing protein [Lachnospiraceae bacterium]